jgi:germination protein M
MSRRVLWIVAAALAAILLLVLLLMVARAPQAPTDDEARNEGPPPTPTPAPEQRVVLLFLGGDGMLYPELRVVRLPEEIEERVRVVVTELVSGPEGTLAPLFTWEAELLGVWVDADGYAYVDISAPPGPLTGSHTELGLVYGIVDSVLLNCPELRGVQLLLGGTEVDSLTGHLDLSRPLALNKDFIVAS